MPFPSSTLIELAAQFPEGPFTDLLRAAAEFRQVPSCLNCLNYLAPLHYVAHQVGFCQIAGTNHPEHALKFCGQWEPRPVEELTRG